MLSWLLLCLLELLLSLSLMIFVSKLILVLFLLLASMVSFYLLNDIINNGKILSMTVTNKFDIKVIYIFSIKVYIFVIIVGVNYIRVTYKVSCY